MILSKCQKAALEVVRELGAVRVEQLLTLLTPGYHPAQHQLDAMLKQLCFGGMLRVTDGIVTASGTDPPAPEYLEAIDVMLEITGGDVLACSAGRSPVLLRFVSGGEKPRGFSVLRAHTGAFFLPLDTLPGQRVIVMMAENDPELRAALPASHFIAVPGAGGLHRFFRCGSK